MNQIVILVSAVLIGVFGYYELWFDKIALSSNALAGLLFLSVGLILACMGLAITEIKGEIVKEVKKS